MSGVSWPHCSLPHIYVITKNEGVLFFPSIRFVKTSMESPIEKREIPLPGASVQYYSRFISPERAAALFVKFQNFPWKVRQAAYAGTKHYQLNRSTCAFGDPGVKAPQIWGNDLVVDLWTPEMLELRDVISTLTGYKFNICLCNKYKNGKQTIGYHADNEERGSISCIASISLGAARKFLFKCNATGAVTELVLDNGSLLIMGPGTQENYKHTVPSEPSIEEERINLTFRWFEEERYKNI